MTNPRNPVLYTLGINFSTVEEKVALITRLAHFRQPLIPCARPPVDNRELMMMLFDKVETDHTRFHWDICKHRMHIARKHESRTHMPRTYSMKVPFIITKAICRQLGSRKVVPLVMFFNHLLFTREWKLLEFPVSFYTLPEPWALDFFLCARSTFKLRLKCFPPFPCTIGMHNLHCSAPARTKLHTPALPLVWPLPMTIQPKEFNIPWTKQLQTRTDYLLFLAYHPII